MQLLKQVGPQGLTIEALCQQLKVTKGSFYHHFEGYEDFKASLLSFYEQEGTLQIIEQVDDLQTPHVKLRKLIDMVIAISTTPLLNSEIAIRAWALQDGSVREVQMRVDQQRLEYLQSLCQEITGDATKANLMAQMLYAILVGSEQMQPALHSVALRALFDEYLRLYQLNEDNDEKYH
ncbi:MAG: TetR/AcrR family transcriptional regulator [Chloroflexota bacterium]